MGRDILKFPVDDRPPFDGPSNVRSTLENLGGMSSKDLKSYFELLFNSMTLEAKQAVAQILYTGLSNEERGPFYRPNLSQNSIDIALQDAFILDFSPLRSQSTSTLCY
jgi:hypothetical protein